MSSFTRSDEPITPPASGQPIDSPPHAWERWQPVWSALFYGLLLVATFGALLGQNPLGGQRLALALSLVFLWLGWYRLMVVGHPERHRQVRPMLLYLVGGLIFWLGLAWLHPAYYLMLFIFYGQIFNLLPVRWAILSAVCLTLLQFAVQLGSQAEITSPQRVAILATFITLVPGSILALWIEAIIRQSRERQQLIEALDAAYRALDESRSALQAEQEKSERLLLNILPAPVAERLKQDPKTIADSFPEVTILFADLVDFTKLSASQSPAEVVEWLNIIFSSFDRLAEQHGVEKIKTIGDAYMAAGGIPLERPDHAEAIAALALDMQQAIAHFNRSNDKAIGLRIGIDTGPVVAGVIGINKFIYDLWGDTVNTASRMESHGVPGAIQITANTHSKLKDRFVCEPRGTIQVKGKGPIATYFLKSKLTHQPDPVPPGLNSRLA
jgi:class 3 adenylate cyclase